MSAIVPAIRPLAVNWLVAALTLAVFGHFFVLPTWVTVTFLVFAIPRLPVLARRLPTLSPARAAWLKYLYLTIVLCGTYRYYGSLLGRDPGVSLLVLLSALKLYELRSERDYTVSVLLGCFLIATVFLYSQSLGTTFYQMPLVALLVAGLIAQQDRGDVWDSLDTLKRAASLLLQAMPFVLVAFILFPRIPGPLWQLPRDARTGQTGLSDTMTPGSVLNVSRSEEVAFRVEFHGYEPAASMLYWRGPVLWRLDGDTWTQGNLSDKRETMLTGYTEPLAYTMLMEPHGTRWAFALDVPGSAPSGTRITPDVQLVSLEPIEGKVRYQLTAYPHYRIRPRQRSELTRALQLPPGLAPRASELARSWRAEGLPPQKIVERALRMFHEEEFFYTLQPRPTYGDGTDDFLFNTREGFCEHYASAFAILMRAAGVPARIVIGYQGGEHNPIGGYYVIRQQDAHAWVEVWLEEEGWQRIDPTAVVSPARIHEGIGSLLETAELPLLTLGEENRVWLRNVWKRLRLGLDALDNSWSQWVVSYGPSRQLQLLARIGLGELGTRYALFAMLAALGIVLATFVWVLSLHRRPAFAEPAQELYERFCNRLARAGVRRRASQGPLDFGRHARTRIRRYASEIEEICRLYARVRYAGHAKDLSVLRRRIKSFPRRPRRNP